MLITNTETTRKSPSNEQEAGQENLHDERQNNQGNIAENGAKSQVVCIPQNTPDELRPHPHFVVWALSQDPNKPKPDKVPFDPKTLKLASVGNRLTWGTFEQACQVYDKRKGKHFTFRSKDGTRNGIFSGIGFVLDETLGLVGIDLDGCVRPDGSLEPWAQEFVDVLNTYTEISPSGTGLRLFVFATLPEKGRRKGKIELYIAGRFLTVTGNIYGEKKPIAHRQNEIATLYEKHFSAPKTKPVQTQCTPPSTLSDAELLGVAFRSKNGAEIKALYEGDMSRYSSQSEADLALCSSLAFYTQKDESRMDSLFRSSGLMRPKWDELHGNKTYGMMTIEQAIATCANVYSPEHKRNTPPSGGDSLMSADEMAARDIADAIGVENLIFCKGRFWHWGGTVWMQWSDDHMKQLLFKRCTGKPKLKKPFMYSVLALLEAMLFADVTFDAVQNCIAVKNGELWLEGGAWVLKPHRRESYRTTCLDVEYLPDAKAERFVQFLFEVFAPDADCQLKVQLVCEAIGYTLLSSTEFEKFLLLIGRGANGKSVLLKVLCYLLGAMSYSSIQPADFANRFQKAELFGKMANIVPELPENGAFPANVIKSIASGESMTAEEKYKKPFKFDPFCTMWIATNILPHCQDYSDGLYRRAVVIPFNRVFDEREKDEKLKYTLKGELSGILNLALAAVQKVIERGYFTEPPSCLEAKKAWRNENDQVRQFIDDMCVLDGGAWVLKRDLFKAYEAWATDNGYKHKLTNIGFGKRVEMKGIKGDRRKQGVGFKGIRLISQCEAF